MSSQQSVVGSRQSVSSLPTGLCEQFTVCGIIKLLGTVLFIFFHSISSAQKLSASLDREKILIGEQVILQLKAEELNSANTFIETWYQFADTFNHIEVIKRETIDTIVVDGLTSYTQKLTLTSFDSGIWKINPSVIIQNKSTSKKTKLKADSLSLEVLPVDVSDLPGYHPIKEIIDVEHKNNLWLWIAIAASAIVLAFAVYKIVTAKKKVLPVAKKKPLKGTPLERAMEKLQHLEDENLLKRQQVKLYHTKMDIIYRQYFEESLAINALKITSDELMIRLNVYLQEANLRSQFYQAMRLNDAVKFAKYIPPKEESEKALNTTKNTLKQVDSLIQKTIGHAN